MQIETLINYLQQIAQKRPGIHVVVAESRDYPQLRPITHITTDVRSYPENNITDIWLSSDSARERPFRIEAF